MIVLVIVIGAGLGWMVHRVQVQRDAVAAIRGSGGTILYNWEWKDGRPDPNRKPWAPKWLVNRFGVDFFGDVVQASLIQGGFDAVMLQIGKLHRLETVVVRKSSITEVGFAHLKELPHLRHLSIFYSTISDCGLVHLKGLTGLDTLSFQGTNIGDAGLAQRPAITNLRSTLAVPQSPTPDWLTWGLPPPPVSLRPRSPTPAWLT